MAVSARIEAELSELDDDEAGVMREELGVPESGLALVVREAFELLDLISFFTAGEDKEARAHAIERGTTAWGAAGQGAHRHPARLRARGGGAVERAGGRRRLRRRRASGER